MRSIGGGAAVCAVKILRPDGNPHAMMMQHHIYGAYHVSHPNVYTVLSAHLDAPPFYFVMPLLTFRPVFSLIFIAVKTVPTKTGIVAQIPHRSVFARTFQKVPVVSGADFKDGLNLHSRSGG